MAKTQIYQQEEALSVYFRDMLAEPGKAKPAPETAPPPHTIEAEDKTTQEQAAAISEAPAPLKLLLCEIGGIKLALTVAELNNIVLWPEQGLNRLPGQADWQLGLLSERDQQVEVVDIRPALQAAGSEAPAQTRYILLVDGRRRGIACDSIEHIITVEAEAVNWRQDRSQRPWFSGVVADSMHNIIDLPTLLSALDSGEMA